MKKIEREAEYIAQENQIKKPVIISDRLKIS